jgi:alpha-amylase/alpha-mannosidase (GH57 family)
MLTNNKYICIHGHFYQPPRENAWLEVLETQDSAAPFHDWNERINFECYAPNTAARILDNQEFITKIVNNYTHISFNFGPTLLSWLERADPETYKAILTADKASVQQFNGYGSALAQVYSHLIMPLANRRDKETQVIWGIRDFEYRFRRKPEGMWLAETAVDTETLEILASHGIQFTVLAPRQAKAIRRLDASEWKYVNESNLDTRLPYLCNLPSGKTITLFFYDGNIAKGVAFEGLLNNGKNFAARLINAFSDTEEPQLVHIATDGESYGHHHRYGEMALADCLNYIQEKGLAEIINYGAYLAQFPPKFAVQIHENSSWSCVHGVERWRSNCGCNTGGHPGWTQTWRAPLRETLDWLRDQLLPIYEREAAKFLPDVWAARNAYIEVILKRTNSAVNDFIRRQVGRDLSEDEKITLLRLMELQREAVLMYTSCGWFFDEISGIETNQILQYANRAIYYAHQVSNVNLHDEFVQRLEKAPSNAYANGAASYRQNVASARVDLTRVGMHYAAASLFEEHPEQLDLFNYHAESELFERYEAGAQRLVLGKTTVRSKITYSEKHFSFAVLYLGQLSIIGNISIDMSRKKFEKMSQEIVPAFLKTDLGSTISLMHRYFPSETFNISNLFKDEKRKIIQQITDHSLRQVEASFREIYNDNYQLMTILEQSELPLPPAFTNVAQFLVNQDMQTLFSNGNLNTRELQRLNGELKKWNLKFTNKSSFRLAASERLYAEIKKLDVGTAPLRTLENLNNTLEALQQTGLQVDFWKSQNLYCSMLRGYQTGEWVFASKEWETEFKRLGQLLKVKTS